MPDSLSRAARRTRLDSKMAAVKPTLIRKSGWGETTIPEELSSPAASSRSVSTVRPNAGDSSDSMNWLSITPMMSLPLGAKLGCRNVRSCPEASVVGTTKPFQL